MKSWILIAALVSGVSACAIRSNLDTPFVDPKNKPVDNTPTDASKGTKYCAPDASGNFDGQTVLAEAGLGQGNVAWAEGGGCVLRPIREVWAALQNIEASRWNETQSATFTRVDHPNKDFTHLYNITYKRGTPIGPIDWTIAWYHGFDLGTFDAPERINITFKKISGTSMIPVWEGTVTLSRVRDGITSFGMQTHFQAFQGNPQNVQAAKDSIGDILAKARTVAPDWIELNTGFHQDPSVP